MSPILIFNSYVEERSQQQSPISKITAREREVLELSCTGHKGKAIADRLNISIKTVEKHIANLRSKLPGEHGRRNGHGLYALEGFKQRKITADQIPPRIGATRLLKGIEAYPFSGRSFPSMSGCPVSLMPCRSSARDFLAKSMMQADEIEFVFLQFFQVQKRVVRTLMGTNEFTIQLDLQRFGIVLLGRPQHRHPPEPLPAEALSATCAAASADSARRATRSYGRDESGSVPDRAPRACRARSLQGRGRAAWPARSEDGEPHAGRWWRRQL